MFNVPTREQLDHRSLFSSLLSGCRVAAAGAAADDDDDSAVVAPA